MLIDDIPAEIKTQSHTGAASFGPPHLPIRFGKKQGTVFFGHRLAGVRDIQVAVISLPLPIYDDGAAVASMSDTVIAQIPEDALEPYLAALHRDDHGGPPT